MEKPRIALPKEFIIKAPGVSRATGEPNSSRSRDSTTTISLNDLGGTCMLSLLFQFR